MQQEPDFVEGPSKCQNSGNLTIRQVLQTWHALYYASHRLTWNNWSMSGYAISEDAQYWHHSYVLK